MALDMAKAAQRHKRCATNLAKGYEQEEAGYLIGLAAECALKHHLAEINFQLKKSKKAKTDPTYSHFPDLRNELLAQGSGILNGRVLSRLADASFFQGWSITLRYQHQTSSPSVRKRYEKWWAQTDSLFKEVGLA